MKKIPFLILISLAFVNCSHIQSRHEDPETPATCKLRNLAGRTEREVKQNPLLDAIFVGDAKKVKELIAAGQDVRRKDSLGFSYLHLAAGIGNEDVIEILIRSGLSVNARMGNSQSTPSHSAVRWGKLVSLKTLVKHGADLMIIDSSGKSVVDLAKEEKKQEIVSFIEQVLRNKSQPVSSPSPK